MTQNENLQRSESNEIILVDTEEETKADSSMTLTSKSLSPKTPSRVNELACVICDEVATENFIHCSDCRNAIHYLYTSLSAYQIYNFINSNRKFTCINYTKEEYNNIVHLTMGSALIEFRENLDQLQVEMHLLQTENEMLIWENVRSNEIKTLKVMQSSKTEEKQSHIKELQNILHQAYEIAGDKTKELNKLKRDIVSEEQYIMLSWCRKNPSLRNKNDIASTQNERNCFDIEIDSLASDLEAFKKFITEELFSLKACVETVRNSGIDQNCETTDKQKSLDRRQDKQEKYNQH